MSDHDDVERGVEPEEHAGEGEGPTQDVPPVDEQPTDSDPSAWRARLGIAAVITVAAATVVALIVWPASPTDRSAVAIWAAPRVPPTTLPAGTAAPPRVSPPPPAPGRGPTGRRRSA